MTSLSENTVVTTSGGLVELAYSQITSSVFPATTTFPASTEVIAPLTVVCDGSPIIVEFWCCYAKPANTADQSLTISLFVDGVENQRYWGYLQTPASANSYKPVHLMCRLTPSAGVHTFGVKALVSAGTGTIGAGAGGGSVESPAFLRVSKIIQASQFIVPLASAPLVTSLPSTGNIDGQEVRYKPSMTGNIGNEIPLRWSAVDNKWKPVGTSVVARFVGASNKQFTVSTYYESFAGGMGTNFTPPWDGYYEVSAFINHVRLYSGIGFTVGFNATDGTSNNQLGYFEDFNGAPAGGYHHKDPFPSPRIIYLYSNKTYAFQGIISYAFGNVADTYAPMEGIIRAVG